MQTQTHNDKFRGSNYTRGLTCKEIAAKVRKELKTLAAGYTFSVRSTHNTIGVEITGIPASKLLFNADYVYFLTAAPDNKHLNYWDRPEAARERFSDEVNTVIAAINAYIKTYNRDNSDSMTDYFDTNFYYSVNVAFDLCNKRATIEGLG